MNKYLRKAILIVLLLSNYGFTTEEGKMKREGIVISQESYHSDDPYEVIYANINYLNALFAEYVRPDEVSDDALKSYYVDYYLAQVNNGGFSQFVYNTGWNKAVVETVRQGLKDMGAVKNLALFEESAGILNGWGEEKIRQYLNSEYFGSNEERDALDGFNDAFYALQESEDLILLNADWIKQHPHLQVLDEQAYQENIADVAKAIPDREQRIQKAREAEPRYLKLIRALCQESGQTLDRVTAGDPSHQYQGDYVVAWHFRTHSGHHYMIEHNGQAMMFNGDSNEVVASIVAGEEYGAE